MDLLRDRLVRNGFSPLTVEGTAGGVVAQAALVTFADGPPAFAKTLADPGPDLFAVEAEGLSTLRAAGLATPEVRYVSPDLLVLQAMSPRPADGRFWERLGRELARLHLSTVNDRFGWHRDGWLGRHVQENSWDADGHRVFAERRVLRWLREKPAEDAFDPADRRALERLCVRLPELVPVMPATLTHGDLWCQNVLADAGGAPVVIDPAVSYAWPETDLSMLYASPRPAEADRLFPAYQEVRPLDDGWRERMALLHLRELMSTIAHGDDDWGAAAEVRRLTKLFGAGPFRARG